MTSKNFAALETIVRQSLEANLHTTSRGTYLVAGANQFASLWTRDFCLAAGGLIHLGRADVVKDQVMRFLENRRVDGLIPRMLDSIPSRNRVLLKTVGRKLGGFSNYLSLREPLIPEYLGEHKTISIDSNLLILLTAFRVNSVFPTFVFENRDGLISVYNFYEKHIENNLIRQGAYEDWQDSATRAGFTFFVNLLHVLVLEQAQNLLPEITSPQKIKVVRQATIDKFFDPGSGLFKSHADLPHISLDGNLLALSENLIGRSSQDGQKFYQKLKAHAIWQAGPGVATVPDYPSEWISWTTKIVGLTHYHDRLLWSWLLGLSARVAALMGDKAEAEKILSRLETAFVRDKMVAEVYSAESAGAELRLFETALYRSEGPFSWGAGQCLEAIAAFKTQLSTNSFI
jgi:glycogen debranching enzyme